MARRGNPDDLPAGFRRALFPVGPPSAAGILWYWRWEALFGFWLPVGGIQLDRWAGAGSSFAVLAAAGAVLVLSESARRWVWGHVRAIGVQHRLRVGFVEAGLNSSQGRLPFLYWTSPEGTGEQSWVWLPAGVTVARLSGAAASLANATWSSEVHISPHPTRAHLARIHVVRSQESS